MVKLRKACALALSLAMMVSFYIPSVSANQFSDVLGSHNFYEYVNYLGTHGVVNGSNGMFYPDRVITRGEITKVVLNAAGIETEMSATRAFEDVDVGSDFFAYINTAQKRNIVSGYGNGTFGPDDLVKRGEAIKILVSAFGFGIDTAGGPHFVDVLANSSFYNYVETAYNLGIVSGRGASFWPSNYMTRGEMSKIVAMAMQGGSDADEHTLVAATSVYPQANVSLSNSTDEKMAFDFTRMPELENGYLYEAWLVDEAGEMFSAGTFNVDGEGRMQNEGGRHISNVLDTNMNIVDYDMVKVTIEPRNDSKEEPSGVLILEGSLNADGEGVLGFPRMGGDLSGSVFVSGTDKQTATFDLRGLPQVDDLGFQYEILVQNAGKYTSLKGFDASEDYTSLKVTYGDDLSEIGKFVVALEPIPDDDSAPYITMMSATIDSASLSEEEVDEDWGTCDIDDSIYEGLTTTMTSESIVCRTVEERDEDHEVIVQAYVSADVVPASAKAAIVVKVSDLDGDPINDLQFDMDQMSGLAGDLDSPSERKNSGVYVGSYVSPDSSDFSLTSDDVVVRISQKNSSSADQYVPPIDVSLDLKSSSRRGTPKVMEIDVPQSEITYDANESGDTDEVVVIATLLDSSHATVESSSGSIYGSSIKLNGSSSHNDNETPDLKEGNLYLYDVDMGDLYNNNDVEVTVSEDFQVEFYDRSSSGSYLPIISDQYEVRLHYIPRD